MRHDGRSGRRRERRAGPDGGGAGRGRRGRARPLPARNGRPGNRVANQEVIPVSELTSELQRMADDADRQAGPLAAAEIIRQGDRRRRRSLARQSLGGLSVAGVAGVGVALGLGLTGSAPAHGTGTIRTAAFTLVSNANGTATLTIKNNVLFEPA